MTPFATGFAKAFMPVQGQMFVMGSPHFSDAPPHWVHVDDFRMSPPVTHEQWTAITGAPVDSDIRTVTSDPVANKSWDEIQRFMEALRGGGLDGARLPTEAESEMLRRKLVNVRDIGLTDVSSQARRGLENFVTALDDSRARIHNGDDEVQALLAGTDPTVYAWYVALSDMGYAAAQAAVQGARLVGGLPEWAADGYDSKFYGRAPLTNPLCDDVTSERVIRGGVVTEQVAKRHRGLPDWSWPLPGTGFRVVTPA